MKIHAEKISRNMGIEKKKKISKIKGDKGDRWEINSLLFQLFKHRSLKGIVGKIITQPPSVYRKLHLTDRIIAKTREASWESGNGWKKLVDRLLANNLHTKKVEHHGSAGTSAV